MVLRELRELCWVGLQCPEQGEQGFLEVLLIIKPSQGSISFSVLSWRHIQPWLCAAHRVRVEHWTSRWTQPRSLLAEGEENTMGTAPGMD